MAALVNNADGNYGLEERPVSDLGDDHTPLSWRTGWARYRVASHSPWWERTW
jgi:hypothetical protein